MGRCGKGLELNDEHDGAEREKGQSRLPHRSKAKALCDARAQQKNHDEIDEMKDTQRLQPGKLIGGRDLMHKKQRDRNGRRTGHDRHARQPARPLLSARPAAVREQMENQQRRKKSHNLIPMPVLEKPVRAGASSQPGIRRSRRLRRLSCAAEDNLSGSPAR